MSGNKSDSLRPFGKSDKKPSKSPLKTYRFSFTLSDPSEDSCSVFDYGAAVKAEERKLLKKKREDKQSKVNGSLNPFDDDDEDVRQLARKFEEKYGNSGSQSYAELGAGYDERDSFIDNTEAYDGELEENQETPCGGYYVNCGPLELMKVDASDTSDADDGITKRKHKRVLSLIDEQEEEVGEKEENDEVVEEQAINGEEEIKENGQEVKVDAVENKIEPENEVIPAAKMTNKEDEKEKEPEIKTTNGLEDKAKMKRKRLCFEDVTAGSGSSAAKVKKIKTVKALLEEKRVQETQSIEEPKPRVETASSTSINEAIESVIRSSQQDENSNSSNSSKSGTTASEDSNDAPPHSGSGPPPLPENLPANVLSLLESIRRAAATTENSSKALCPVINGLLERLRWISSDLPNAHRNSLFAHLSFYLQRSKETLMRKSKELFLSRQENELENVLAKLKATIDSMMPALELKYEKERQRAIESQGLSTNHTSESVSPKLPKRRFSWSQEIRGYLKEIVRLKKRCFKVLKPRKCSFEEYITDFLSSKVLKLWPLGWVRTSSLLRESNLSQHSEKSSRTPPNNKNDSSRHNSRPRSPSAKVKPEEVPSKADTTLDSLPDHQQHKVKQDKPESNSVNHQPKRTHVNSKCQDFKTTLSDLINKEGVIMNGTSQPLNSVHNSSSNENVLDLSGCNISTSGCDRTGMRASDSVSLNSHTHQMQSEGLERRLSEETATATDMLSQIINESLLAPSPIIEEKRVSPVTKGQELLFDATQDLKELNLMSSKPQLKNSYGGTSWPSKPVEQKAYSTSYHQEFVKHAFYSSDTAPGYPTPYSSVSPYESPVYTNDTNNSGTHHIYTSPHKPAQSLLSHDGSTLPNHEDSMMNYSLSHMPHMNHRAPHHYGWYPGSESQPQP